MLLIQNIRLSRILRNTWQVDLIMIVSCTGAYLIREYLIAYHFEIPSIIPTVLGTAIAFFIGFNNNQAYDRWWEGRKIWGSLVNDSRSFARCLINYVDKDNEVAKKMVFRHIAFLYALKANLRGTVDEIYIKYLSEEDLKEIEKHSNAHNAILNIQSRDLQILSKTNAVDGFRFIEINEMLTRFSDSMGMSERIKNTIFPTTYTYLTKVFIWLFVVTFTLVISQSAGIFSIFLGWLIGFVFVSTQINGMSLVNPFENNSAGVPLNQITRTIEINLLQMLGEDEIPEPVKPINEEYIL
ncbi:bestrophin family protein [Pedobacter punctiformis]|uniref:Bestrophin family ion channel n=1 Tax=Pedobacter punctiformis TaxID=3004097 RepID=A0ABT4L956_9SPHI|nr:bestrophin family ion channel [Pedobacter sp. HCMS5-2]MCZ4243344.1 bestrophin family ion channel [Pedobacter sp. HCMS5-2]